MVKSKLFSLLRLIRKEEWKEFEKFSASPYFNKGRNYKSLLKILSRYYPEFDSENLSKENLYKKLYPGKIYNEYVVNTILSGITRLCEEFFIYQNFNSNNQREIILLKEYSKRGYEQGASKFCRDIEKLISGSNVSSMNFFLNLDRIDALQNHYAFSYDKEKRSSALESGIVNVVYFMMIQLFIFEKELLFYNQRYSKENFNQTYPGRLLGKIEFEKLLSVIEESDKKAYLILRIYFLLVKQLKEIDKDNIFFEIKDLLNENINFIDTETQNKLLLNLESICNMKSNRGQSDFLKEGYSIMKKLTESGFYENLSESGNFPPSHFRNIVKAGIFLGDVEWIEDFVRKNSGKLEHSQIDPLKYYSLAKIAFVKKDFDNALENLSKVFSENYVFKMDIKKLTAMIYFETKSFTNLQSLLNAYDQSITKKGKKTEIINLRHKNFIKYIRKLENIVSTGKDMIELERLKDAIVNENVSEKNWLIEKLDSLIKST